LKKGDRGGFKTERNPRALLPAAVLAQGPATGEGKGALSTVEKASTDFDALKGRWLRPDGGYLLSVKDVDVGGKLKGIPGVSLIFCKRVESIGNKPS
jgi:hypothetical protein